VGSDLGDLRPSSGFLVSSMVPLKLLADPDWLGAKSIFLRICLELSWVELGSPNLMKFIFLIEGRGQFFY